MAKTAAAPRVDGSASQASSLLSFPGECLLITGIGTGRATSGILIFACLRLLVCTLQCPVGWRGIESFLACRCCNVDKVTRRAAVWLEDRLWNEVQHVQRILCSLPIDLIPQHVIIARKRETAA